MEYKLNKKKSFMDLMDSMRKAKNRQELGRCFAAIEIYRKHFPEDKVTANYMEGFGQAIREMKLGLF